MRLSLDTIWELRRGNDPGAGEVLHDFYWREMMEERYGIFLSAGQIQVLPLKEEAMSNKNDSNEPTSKKSKRTEKFLTLAVSSLQAMKSVLAAAKQYVKHFGDDSNK